MCGITGFTWEDKSLLKRMTGIISYRGPDDHGYHTDKDISLGHRRLSIIDLSSAGRQPMTDKEGTVTIVYNGEIYNFKELRKELEKKHSFSSNTDTEVLIHGYKQWGPEGLLKRLNGMFAFAIWDSKNKTLFMARDRLGIKPLYYAQLGDRLIFASEIKSILECPDLVRELDVGAVNSYLTYRFIPSAGTVLKGIKKLLPGHYLIFSKGKMSVKKYWDLKFRIAQGSEQHFVKMFRALLSDCVEKRLMSDVPLGAYLSGGIDSSLIVAVNSMLREDPVKTFTVGFGHETDEFRYAQKVAEHLGTDHHELMMDYKDMSKTLPKILWFMDEPNSDITMVPLYFLSQFSRKKVTVVNTGEGADELFSGYQHFRVGSDSFRLVPSFVKKSVYSLYYSPFKGPERRALFTKAQKDDDSLKRCLDTKQPKHLLNRILLFDIKNELPNWQLARVDRMTMAHAQEARVPFLDHRMVEFSATLPINFKLRKIDGKYLVKRAASNLLPKEILTRKKQGFTTPRDAWFRNDFMECAFNILSKENMRRRKYINTDYVEKLKQKVRKTGDKPFRPYTYKLLILTMLEMWQQMYLDNKSGVMKLDRFF
jgi:asparagine synthase (glutamine-hydrolysing)